MRCERNALGKEDDPQNRLPYIGRAMMNEAQIDYIESVLGASADYFRARARAPQPAVAPSSEPLVITPRLSDEETALLAKILASVNLIKYTHSQIEEIDSAWSPPAQSSFPTLVFSGAMDPGRKAEGERIWWSFPQLKEMLGSGAKVGEVKRTTWSILQQFAKEQSK